MTNFYAFVWSDHRIDLLLKRWAEGWTAAQVAAELSQISGHVVTRNAVIGKVSRLGLEKRKRGGGPRLHWQGAVKRAAHPRPPATPKVKLPVTVRQRVAIAIAAAPEPELLDNMIPIGQRRSILQLTEATCHWPIGDPSTPTFFFCGGEAIDGLPYCRYHTRVAYQPRGQVARGPVMRVDAWS